MDKKIQDKYKQFFKINFIIMESLEQINEPKIKIKVSDLVKKFKTKQDIKDYCREQSKTTK